MNAPAKKPAPLVDVWNKPFWNACTEKKLILQVCLDTEQFFFPPAPVSPFTGKARWEWREVSGRGTIWSFVVFHQQYFAGFADELPYPVVMVKLEEGPFLLTNLRDAQPSNINIGQRVSVVFDDDAVSLPQFRPEHVQ